MPAEMLHLPVGIFHALALCSLLMDILRCDTFMPKNYVQYNLWVYTRFTDVVAMIFQFTI